MRIVVDSSPLTAGSFAQYFVRMLKANAQSKCLSALYERVEGLDGPVRDLHVWRTRATGRFRVERGRKPGARVVAWLLRLPKAGREVPLTFRAVRSAAGEVLHRRFGGRVLRTRQFVRDGELVERYGPLEFTFRLVAQDGALRFIQKGCGVRVGPLLLGVPRGIRPHVESWCSSPDGCRAGVAVRITAPRLGLVLAYEGLLDE